MIVRLKHVHRRTAKGRVYFYHRRTGERLPDDPEARARRVLEINAGVGRLTPASPAEPGSFADLCELYLGLPEFTRLAPATRASYRRRIDWLRARWGTLRVATMTAEAVLALRDKLAVTRRGTGDDAVDVATPRKADWMIQVLRRVLSIAVRRPSRFGLTHNPAARPGRLWRPSPDANRAWTPAELEAFLAGAPPAVALAVALAAYTGQRQGDVLRMTWSAIAGDRIALRQGKTGERVEIPIHPRLAGLLAVAPRGDAVTIVAGARGRPLGASGFQSLFQRARRRLGFAAGLTFHGLRHTVAQALAEAGAPEAEIMAVTGHRTSAMVVHYTRRARARLLAAAAMRRLETGTEMDNAQGTGVDNRPARTS